MNQINVTIVDYGAGNLRSVARAFETLGATPHISSDPKTIMDADALLLPGQGACDSAMAALQSHNLNEAIVTAIESGTPFFGVCLGLQLLLEFTEEGPSECLGIVAGGVRRLPTNLKVPHMGWNTVTIVKDHPVFADIPQESYFYFVHSYYADPTQLDIIAANCNYGIEFCSAIAIDNVVATQFHPEKSGVVGLKLYRNFLEMIARS